MQVHSLISSARQWLICVLAVSGAGVAQAGGVYWSVGIDVPIERHGRVGTMVSNVPGSVVRGNPTVVAPVRHLHARPVWAGPRQRHVVHHHVHHRGWRGHDARWEERRDQRRELRREHHREHRTEHHRRHHGR